MKNISMKITTPTSEDKMAKKKKASKKKVVTKMRAVKKPSGKRRSKQQVNETIQAIKDAVAMGNDTVSVAQACKMYSMTSQQYYKYKDRVGDSKDETIEVKLLTLKQGHYQSVLDDIQDKINSLKSEIFGLEKTKMSLQELGMK